MDIVTKAGSIALAATKLITEGEGDAELPRARAPLRIACNGGEVMTWGSVPSRDKREDGEKRREMLTCITAGVAFIVQTFSERQRSLA